MSLSALLVIMMCKEPQLLPEQQSSHYWMQKENKLGQISAKLSLSEITAVSYRSSTLSCPTKATYWIMPNPVLKTPRAIL